MSSTDATDAKSELKPGETSSVPTRSELTQPLEPKNSIQFPTIDQKLKMTSTTSNQKEFSFNSYHSAVKLSTGTFNDWKLKLTTVLGAQRLSKFILKDLTPPDESDEVALENFETNSLRALAAIHATIDDENFQVVRSCTSPREAFQLLCKHHDDAGGLSTAHLFSDLVTLKMTSDDNLNEHIHKFRKLHNDLLSNLASTPDSKISEPFIAVILIKSLPSEYTPLVQSLLSNFETLTLARLYSLLKIEATRNAPTQNSDTALAASRTRSNHKNKQGKKKEHSENTSSIQCSLGHPGHTDEQCRTRRWKAFREFEKKSKSDQSTSSHAAQVSQPTHENEEVSYWEEAFSASTSTTNPIICDTGATNHMFSDLSLISDLKHIKPVRIGVASHDGAIWAKNAGTVRSERKSDEDA